MKRFIVAMQLVALLLYAATDVTTLELRILDAMARIFVQASHPTVFFDTPNVPNPLTVQKSGVAIRPVYRCERADVIFTENIDALKRRCRLRPGQILITLSYRDYIRHRDTAAGAFFWQKGRPNILLNETFIRRHHLSIPEEYRKFVE